MRNIKAIANLIDEAKNELSVEESFLNELKRSIEIREEQGRRLPSQYYKPSSMNCLRNMFYQRVGKEIDEKDTTYTNVGICNAGTDIHVRIQKAILHMKETGADCKYLDVGKFVQHRELTDIEVKQQSGMETKLFNKRLQMSFMCDGIIKYKKHYYILELKSESSYKWIQRAGVDPSHYRQATAYSISLGLPEVLFIYINRDNMDMKSYMFKPTSDMKNDLEGIIQNCEGYVNRMITPPKPEDVSRKTCEYCDYKTACRKEA